MNSRLQCRKWVSSASRELLQISHLRRKSEHNDRKLYRYRPGIAPCWYFAVTILSCLKTSFSIEKEAIFEAIIPQYSSFKRDKIISVIIYNHVSHSVVYEG